MIEKLPYPHVIYPAFNGSFVGFKENKNSSLYFCECNKKAIRNFIKLRLFNDNFRESDRNELFLLDSLNFPMELTEQLIRSKVKQDERIINHLNFADKICHLCNMKYPENENLNTKDFYNQFLIYINMLSYQYGIRWFPWKVVEEECPDELLELIEVDRNLACSEVRKLNPESRQLTELNKNTRDKINEIMDPIFRQENKIRKYIENQIRRIYGLKDAGDYWINETKLYKIIKDIFPDQKIERHFRPLYLKGLELDIFVGDLKLGIEYQGKQHYEPVEFWGGVKSYEELKKRDRKKRKLCGSLDVSLIFFKYDEDINEGMVRSKLSAYLIK